MYKGGTKTMFSKETIMKKAKEIVDKAIPYSGDSKAVTFVISIVTGLVAVVISIAVGVLILSRLQPQITGTDATSNATINSTMASGYGALNIAAILPYVIVGGAAVLILTMYFGGRKGQ